MTNLKKQNLHVRVARRPQRGERDCPPCSSAAPEAIKNWNRNPNRRAVRPPKLFAAPRADRNGISESGVCRRFRWQRANIRRTLRIVDVDAVEVPRSPVLVNVSDGRRANAAESSDSNRLRAPIRCGRAGR